MQYIVLVSTSMRVMDQYIKAVLNDCPYDPKYIKVYDFRTFDRARFCNLKEAHFIYRSWEIPLLEEITKYLNHVKCPIKYSE